MQLQGVKNIEMSVYRSVLFPYYVIAHNGIAIKKILAEHATKTQHRSY